MTKRTNVTGEIYHIYNRGVDKRVVFMDSEDYSYFIHLLFVLNGSETINNVRRDFKYKNEQTLIHDGGPTSIMAKNNRENLVDIFAFVQMPNHYHLLLKQNVNDGISKFMHKLGTAYTMFFNSKEERSGSLFQGKYKSVHIFCDRQLLYIPHYIHLNPIKDKNFESKFDKVEHLKNYKWSSYIDYINGNNFPSVTKRQPVIDLFGSSVNYNNDLMQFLENAKDFSRFDTENLIDY